MCFLDPGGIPSPLDNGSPGSKTPGGLKPGEMPEPPKPAENGGWVGGQAPPVPMSGKMFFKF